MECTQDHVLCTRSGRRTVRESLCDCSVLCVGRARTGHGCQSDSYYRCAGSCAVQATGWPTAAAVYQIFPIIGHPRPSGRRRRTMQRGCCFSRVGLGIRPIFCEKTKFQKGTKNHPRPHPKRVNKKNKNTKKDPTLSFILREKCARRLQREQCIAVALQRQVLRSRHSSAHSLRTDASVTRRASDMLL